MKRLYVGNLSYNTTENTLKAAFMAQGNITQAKIIVDRETGNSKGFAFVEFENAEDAQAAITAWNGADLDGRSLRVSIAEERKMNGGGGGGYTRPPQQSYQGTGGGYSQSNGSGDRRSAQPSRHAEGTQRRRNDGGRKNQRDAYDD